MLSPTNTILMAIAACDLLMVLCPAPWFVYAYTLDKWVTHDCRLLKILIVFLLRSHQDMDWGRTSCFLFEMFAETLPQMFHNASIYLTLVLALQRYIYICQATRYFIPITRLHYSTHNITEPDTW